MTSLVNATVAWPIDKALDFIRLPLIGFLQLIILKGTEVRVIVFFAVIKNADKIHRGKQCTDQYTAGQHHVLSTQTSPGTT